MSEFQISRWVTKLKVGPLDSEYGQHVAGKTVAIVGPAEITKNDRQGNNIDVCDLVIRFNNIVEYLPIPELEQDDIGSRTDIVYMSPKTNFRPLFQDHRPLLHKALKENNIRWLICANNGPHESNNTLTGECNDWLRKSGVLTQARCAWEASVALLEWLSQKAGRRVIAMSGLIAILDLLLHGVSKVYITGMTFYHKGGHRYRQVKVNELTPDKDANGTLHPHDGKLEFMLFKQLIAAFPDQFALAPCMLRVMEDLS